MTTDPTVFRIPAEQIRSIPIELIFLDSGPDRPDLDAAKNAVAMGKGTAFLYELDGQTYLVTARHCFSGKNSETGAWCADFWTNPTHVRFIVRPTPPPEGWQQGAGVPVSVVAVPLLNANWKPAWFEHPEYGADMDVAVIPVNKLLRPDLFIDAYRPPSDAPDQPVTDLTVAQDVFIVGYPYGLASGFAFPVWVRGTIATEPSMFYTHRDRDLPLLLVDARTREGCSGAPVIVFRQSGTVVRRNDGELGVAEHTHCEADLRDDPQLFPVVVRPPIALSVWCTARQFPIRIREMQPGHQSWAGTCTNDLDAMFDRCEDSIRMGRHGRAVDDDVE